MGCIEKPGWRCRTAYSTSTRLSATNCHRCRADALGDDLDALVGMPVLAVSRARGRAWRIAVAALDRDPRSASRAHVAGLLDGLDLHRLVAAIDVLLQRSLRMRPGCWPVQRRK